ncbi:MAG: metal ABC transporter ATP-binding protein [Syntrophomonadaceae bacterium]|nr:metal ABC transporter ATP-binding protein [Syntrophomonadaceae bacterium]MDD3890386.1 metal ABC transporter ATP-binding protein [Syntrophomonadaceae bacterium]MDD4550365.1 metal ABC transporter ATP-binding protein [Syntrophomonadaceae bacterium]
MQNVIEISNVSVYFENVCALSDISLQVKEKDFLGIIGPNGGGKSTLLKVILGLLNPSAGEVRILGLPPGKAGGKLAYVPQFSKFNRQFPINVRDVALMGCLPRKSGFFHHYSSEDVQVAREVMQQLDIYELRDRQIGQLSGGQMQRVLIARALALKPEIILLDEPTASLDSRSKSQIYAILKELNKAITIVMVSHDMGVISSHIKSLACLNTSLHYHGEPELSSEVLGQTYGCPVELIAHGIPHRVVGEHLED